MPIISRYRRRTDAERAKSNKYLVMERTTGIYGHLPKYINHKKHPFKYGSQGPYQGMEIDQYLYDQWLESAKWPWQYIRRTYVGYLVLLTKKNRYVFNYQGNPYRHGKIFERFPR